VISSLIHRFGTWLVLYHTVCLWCCLNKG
jgi:hypothetical protein